MGSGTRRDAPERTTCARCGLTSATAQAFERRPYEPMGRLPSQVLSTLRDERCSAAVAAAPAWMDMALARAWFGRRIGRRFLIRSAMRQWKSARVISESMRMSVHFRSLFGSRQKAACSSPWMRPPRTVSTRARAAGMMQPLASGSAAFLAGNAASHLAAHTTGLQSARGSQSYVCAPRGQISVSAH